MKALTKTLVATVANGNKVFVTFSVSDDGCTFADISAENIFGYLRLIQNGEEWIPLHDDLDRVKLFEGVVAHELKLDVNKIYERYISDLVTE